MIHEKANLNKMDFFEEKLGSTFDFRSASTLMKFKRTLEGQFYLNDGYHVGVLLKNAQLLERVQSLYQDIRVFDTESMGRIMALDCCVQISNELDDNYTFDMIRFVIEPGKVYENILILGAGDLVIPSYLISNYRSSIKHVTVVEIDRFVCEIVKKYFKFSEILDREDSQSVFTLKFDDGANFVKYAKENSLKFDGIIIDCTDVDVEDGVASSLFTVQFYKNLREIMKNGVVFSQQISDTKSMKRFEIMIKEAGFTDFRFIFSETPEYSVLLPVGIVRK